MRFWSTPTWTGYRRGLLTTFDPGFSHEEIAQRYPRVMQSTQGFNAPSVREALLQRGGPTEAGFVRHAYRPFDTRWLYWEAESGLLDRPRPEYQAHAFEGNLWLGSNKREIHDEFTHGTFAEHLGNWKLGNWGIHFFPARLREETFGTDASVRQRHQPDSRCTGRYLERVNLAVEDLFHHVLAVLHDPAYRQTNAGALRMEWPRIPLPHWSELSVRSGAGETDVAAKIDEASETLAGSVARGRSLGRAAGSRDAGSRRDHGPASS